MTSKISFFKMIKNDCKRRLWLFILISVSFLILLPLVTAVFCGHEQLQLTARSIYEWEVVDDFRMLLRGSLFFVSVGIVVSAVLAAFSGFRYLYKRTKLDVYHSIPVKREKLFFVQYTSGLLLFAIPFVVCYLLMMLICALNGFFMGEIFLMILQSASLGLLHFLAYYNMAILAIMLTGKMIVGILGMIVSWIYMPIVSGIIQWLHARFFVTYYAIDFGERISDWLAYLSPVSLQVLQATSDATYLFDDSIWKPIPMIVTEIVMILSTLAISVWLYCKRPSEAAERAMAFPRMMPAMKVLILIIMSLTSGMFFDLIGGSIGWFIFGLIFGLVISQGVVEVVYNGDIRKMFAGKKAFLISATAVAVIVTIFGADLFGYDSYLPNANSVKSAAISISDLDKNVTYEADSTYVYGSISPNEYRMKYGIMEDVPALYEIAKKGIANNKGRSTELEMEVYEVADDYDVEYGDVLICYHMNGGRKVYRSYKVALAEIEPDIAQLYEEPSFKEMDYPILTSNLNKISRMGVNNPYTIDGRKDIEKAADVKKLAEAYQEDLKQLKFSDVQGVEVMGTISYDLEPEDILEEAAELASFDSFEPLALDRAYDNEYPIYPAFKKTLAVLKELEIELKGALSLGIVTYIRISRKDEGYRSNDEITIEDPVEVAAMLRTPLYAVKSRFYSNPDSELCVDVYSEDGAHNRHFHLKEEFAPAFVQEYFIKMANDQGYYGENSSYGIEW